MLQLDSIKTIYTNLEPKEAYAACTTTKNEIILAFANILKILVAPFFSVFVTMFATET